MIMNVSKLLVILTLYVLTISVRKYVWGKDYDDGDTQQMSNLGNTVLDLNFLCPAIGLREFVLKCWTKQKH